jgi:ribose transport system ATP-binding protein
MIEFRQISKAFSGVRVLRNVTFAVAAGHTLGLVGENGAGKSTLMNILGGNHPPDEGEMRLAGRVYSPANPQDATRHGIAFIHQELNLFGNLSIAENLFLTAFPRRGRLPFIDGMSLQRRAKELMDEVGLLVPPDTLVEKLSAGEQQLVEIAKALSVDARVLILDEPTTSLSSQETERLFRLLQRLRARGLSLIFISHNLQHVMQLCDDLVILRDGEVVGGGPRTDFTMDQLVSLMVGRSLSQLFPARSTVPTTETLLEVCQLTQPGVVREVTFSLHRGEVLGLAGLMGSGRSELARILFGLDPFSRGEVLREGKPIRPDPRGNVRRGFAFLTENRREEGLCLEAAIADNIALVTLSGHCSTPLRWLDLYSLRGAVDTIRQAVRLTPSARNEAAVKTLSGGNQQKVVLAKWLLANPSVFLLDEPTRGIDVGAKYEVYQLINEIAARGAGVLVISSEIEELIGMCDRILVMNRGEIRDSLKREEFDRERILRAALHSAGDSVASVTSAAKEGA